MRLDRAIKFADRMVVLPEESQDLIVEMEIDGKARKTTFRNINPKEDVENIHAIGEKLSKFLKGTFTNNIYVSLKCSIKDK